ncbi:MAG: trehalose 6-phosphate phosphatase [Burkholderiales bacterium]|jgi:trehalose-6-phosphatase
MALPFRNCSSSRLDQVVNSRVVCAFDFDGTLALPAAPSEKMHVPLGIVIRLLELSSYAPVALISLRQRTDIHACLEFEPDFVLAYSQADTAMLSRLMNESGARSVIYVGNAVSDEDVFRLGRNDLLSVRIGHAPHSTAEFFLSHRLDLVQLLDELNARLRRVHAENWFRRGAGVNQEREAGGKTLNGS